MTKTVSIIVPTHDRPAELARALQSIAGQSYKDFEVIVINDNGCDIQNIIDNASKNLDIKYFRHETNKGPGASRNTGIAASSGKYITYLDDDDVLYPNHIETLTNFLESSKFQIAYTDAYRILQEKQNEKYVTIAKEVYHSQDFNRDYFMIASYIAVQSIMHQKACLDKTGLFDESLTTHEDLDLWIRLSHWYDFAHIPQITSEFYEKNDGISQTGTSGRRRLINLELLYNRYKDWSSPEVQYVQKRVLQRMYKNYSIPLPDHLK
jgi:glycosyltransferase involved in cell wall biosynthesis